MSKSSRDYWQEREEEARKHTITDEKEYKKHLDEIYLKMQTNISREIEGFYGRYATKNGITMDDARKRASKADMEALALKAKQYVAEKDFSDQANEEMALYNLTMKVNRLELLKAQMGLELLAGYSDAEREIGKDILRTAMKEYERMAGVLGNSVKDAEKYAHALVNASFRHAAFSDRLWNSENQLKNELERILRIGLIQGRNPNALSPQIEKAFGVGQREAIRLVITEMCRVQTEVQKQSYERNGYKKYMIITCGEDACEECQKMDGRVFNVADMAPGDNAPPFHPSCRCSTTEYVDRTELDELIRRIEEEREGARRGEIEAEKSRGQINNERTAHKHPIDQGIIKSAVNPMIKSDGTVKQTDVMRPHNIFKNLESSSVGRTALNYLKRNQVNIKIYYNVDNPYGDSGLYDPVSDEIIVYGDVTKTIHETACTIIHETAHRILGCSQTRSEEVICFMEEAKHIKGKLTMDDVNAIVKAVNDSERYRSLPWGDFNVWDEKYLE